MGTSFGIPSLDEKLHNLKNEPIFLDSIDTTTLEGRRIKNNFLYAKYNDGIIDVAMSCDCGALKTNQYHGKRCSYCNTVVQSRVDRIFEPRLWYRKPNGIEKLFNPIAWIMLGTNLSIGNFNIIAYFCDRTRDLAIRDESSGKYIEQLPFERGYNNFILNYEEIINALIVPKIISSKKKRLMFQEWFNRYKDFLFTDCIPLPNRDFVVMEQTGNARYSHSTNVSAIDAINTLDLVNKSIYSANGARTEKRLVMFYEQITEYYNVTLSKFIGTKHGIMRKNIFGEYQAWTGRCVMTSICGPHAYDEVELPWAMSLRLFRVHLHGMLMKRYDLSPNEIEEKLQRAVTYIDPIISELLDELIETAYQGSCCIILGRNPTIYKGNILRLRCRTIKRDVNDMTLGVSILVVRLMNGDFDGDEGNITLCVDNKMTDSVNAFGPHTNILEESSCWKVSKNIGLPAPLIANTNSYLIARGSHWR